MSTENKFVPKPGDYIRWKNYLKSQVWHYGFVFRVTSGFMGNFSIELRRFGKGGGVLKGHESYNLMDMRDCEPTSIRMGEYNTQAVLRVLEKLNQQTNNENKN